MSDVAQPPKPRGIGILILAAIFFAATLPMLWLGRDGTPEAHDQNLYHLPVIKTMAEQWPQVDLVNYESATSPGYHLALAIVYRHVADRVTVLRAINLLVGLLCVLAVFWWAHKAAGGTVAVVFCLPLLLSKYVLAGSIWLTTDNAAMLFVVCGLGLAVFHCSRSSDTSNRDVPAGVPARLIGSGLFCAAAVGIRQIHLWSITPLLLIAVFRSPLAGLVPRSIRNSLKITKGISRSWDHLAIAVAAAALSIALLAVFVVMWGGLMPPAYTDMHHAGVNTATYAYTLAMTGVFGPFYVLLVLSHRRDAERQRLLADFGLRLALLAGMAGLVVAMIFPTSYNFEAGRRGGWLWAFVQYAPVIADRSLLIAVFAAAGAASIAVLFRRAAANDNGLPALLLTVTMIGFILAQSVNSQCWQRYVEPFVLMGVIWLAALALNRDSRFNPAKNRLALVCFAIPIYGQAVYALEGIYLR